MYTDWPTQIWCIPQSSATNLLEIRDPEDDGTVFLRNFSEYATDTTQHPRRCEPSAAPLWRPQFYSSINTDSPNTLYFPSEPKAITSTLHTTNLSPTSLTMRTALFCVVTQRVPVMSYRRFETTYRVPISKGCPEMSVRNYRDITQKSEVNVYFAAEASNHPQFHRVLHLL